MVEVVADLDRQVAAAQRDLLEAGDLQLLADRVGVRPSRRARARRSARRSPRDGRGTASTTSSARRTQSLSSLRRQTTAQSRPPGHERGATLRSACDRVGEEHQAHPREGVVEALAERERPGRRRRRSSTLLDLPPPRAAPARRTASETSTPTTSSRGADQLGEPLAGVAEAAAEVEHALAGPGGSARQRLPRPCAPRPLADQLAEARRSGRRAARSKPRLPRRCWRRQAPCTMNATPSPATVGEAAGAQRLGAVLVGPPAAHPAVAQLEDPGHLVLAGGAAVLVPVPGAADQRHRAAAAALQAFLVELLELDRLLHAAGLPRRPHPRRLGPLAQPRLECSSTSGSSTATNASRSRSLKARMNSRTGSSRSLERPAEGQGGRRAFRCTQGHAWQAGAALRRANSSAIRERGAQ